ncbi:hypothetical protein FRAAL3742 [Frankia alni ACN14a]|uniref:Uncharacterized protein n=1 Tax=Frankia alni (strain DSM 45986 / CECT 9034 / ACN14a) TaxID=326424 RepID=Q0RJC7_FRAAA|nr:hypothetical protein FRAAL3742 [Frankia alni ACN14a]
MTGPCKDPKQRLFLALALLLTGSCFWRTRRLS